MPFVMVNLHSQFRILNTRLAQGFSEPENFQRTRAELLENIVHYNAIVKWVTSQFAFDPVMMKGHMDVIPLQI